MNFDILLRVKLNFFKNSKFEFAAFFFKFSLNVPVVRGTGSVVG